MATDFICVECGDPVEHLYVEYSQRNIRLTRCQGCGKVGDKYVEYELPIVVIDAVLHREAAYRHLLNNRLSASSIVKALRIVTFVSVSANAVLRLIVLRYSIYGVLNLYTLGHALVATFLELFLQTTVMIATITYGDTSRALQVKGNNMVNKVYLSVGFPEILKLVAILLQMFDNEGNLLFLIGLLTLSIQCMAFRCLTNLGKDKIVLAALMTITIRTLVKYVFYTTQDILRIGVIN